MIQDTINTKDISQHGVIVIDKPEGYSSAKTVAQLKKISWIKKVGHTGTLDPFATGVIICGINKGTKLSRFLLNGNKTYIAELVLGIETDTQDATGEILYKHPDNPADISKNKIIDIIKNFEGTQKQLPPVYSALKLNGVPLYKLARKGTPVQKPAREITIYNINIIKTKLPSVWFEVSCSAGTYIRTLCNDIGKKIGCGGHLKTLRRTESCGFNLEDAISLSELFELENNGKLKNKLISMSQALKNMPECIADDQLAERIRYGKLLNKDEYTSLFERADDQYIKIINRKDHLLAILSNNMHKNTYKYCCVFEN